MNYFTDNTARAFPFLPHGQQSFDQSRLTGEEGFILHGHGLSEFLQSGLTFACISLLLNTTWRIIKEHAIPYFKQFIISSVTLDNNSPLFDDLLYYLNLAGIYSNNVFATSTLVSPQQPCELELSPSGDWTRIPNTKGLWVTIERSIHPTDSGPSVYSRATIWRFGWTKDPIIAYLNTLNKCVFEKRKDSVLIFKHYTKPDHYTRAWLDPLEIDKRKLSTVVLDDDLKDDIVEDIGKFLNSEKLYAKRGIPYRYGILLHGPPGTGKSSLIFALAGHYNRPIFIISLHELSSGGLRRCFHDLPKGCFIILEDIDTSGIKHTADEPKTSEKKADLSSLLNELDGIGSTQGRIVIMTANRPETLDEALIRPGRVDKRVFLSLATQGMIEELFNIIFDNANRSNIELNKLAERVARTIPANRYSMADLQGFFLLYLEKPCNVLQSITKWMEDKEMEGKGINDKKVKEIEPKDTDVEHNEHV